MYVIFTYIWMIFRANVGKYASTMEHLGTGDFPVMFFPPFRLPTRLPLGNEPSDLLPWPANFAADPGSLMLASSSGVATRTP